MGSFSIDKNNIFYGLDKEPLSIVNLPIREIGIVIHKIADSVYEHVLYNQNSPFVIWLQDIQTAFSNGQLDIPEEAVKRLLELTENSIRYRHTFSDLKDYLSRWKNLPDLPPNLIPPNLKEEDLPSRSLRYLTGGIRRPKGSRKSKA